MAVEIKKMKPKSNGEKSEKRLAVAALVLGVCVALVLGIALATGGGRSRRIPHISAQDASAPEASQPEPTVKLEDVEVSPLSIYTRRNIFKPLVNMEVAAETTTGTGSPFVVMPPQLDPDVPGGTVVSTALTLESVFDEGGRLFARIRVGDQLFEKVAVGDTFAVNYKLLELRSDSRATVLYGDERFTISAGQSIYW